MKPDNLEKISVKIKRQKSMNCKDGFLLVELMLGLLLSILCMVIITHYIIEAQSMQQKAMKKIEVISTQRNEIENHY